MIKISVLLAVYNGEKYIRKSLDSLLAQTYKDMEILIGFNGTTDSSRDIVGGYQDGRIRVFDYGNDKGKAKTLNRLLKQSTGNWIAIQDDDDIWMPGKLEKQIAYCQDYDIIGTQIEYINEKDETTGNVMLATGDRLIKQKSFQGDNQVANTSAIVRKSSLEEVNGWREDVDGIEDFDLWLRLMRKEFRFINLDSVEVRHRLHQRSNFNTQKHDLSKILKPSQSRWKKIFNMFKG